MQPKPSTPFTLRPVPAMSAALAIALALLPIAARASAPGSPSPAVARPTEPATGRGRDALAKLEESWGIKLLALRGTAAGYMLDLRFRVLDEEKAAPLLSRRIERYLVVEKSRAVLAVPTTEKLGALRSAVSTPKMVKRNRTYGALFANPGGHVKPGDRVTLVLGDFMAEHVPVE